MKKLILAATLAVATPAWGQTPPTPERRLIRAEAIITMAEACRPQGDTQMTERLRALRAKVHNEFLTAQPDSTEFARGVGDAVLVVTLRDLIVAWNELCQHAMTSLAELMLGLSRVEQ
jgi:hypothetical protein